MSANEFQLLYLWLTFTALALLGIAGVLVWAVRSGQFSDQRRARWLPLLRDDAASGTVTGAPATAPAEPEPKGPSRATP